jgi:NAD(P)-dependent dehydrogenase (short-subunit alcohol dehydrogenase family)
MGLVDGKVALVTGAGSGIGRAAALVFAKEGAKVIVSDMMVESGEETVKMIKEAGGEATFIKADVSQESDVQMMISKSVETYGRLDCAVNNAGIDGDTALTADCTRENWDRVIGINLTGVFLGLKYQIPQMQKQGGGAIVNIASTMGVVAHQNVPAYVASKHGVVGLTKSTALGYVKEKIRVNAVCPGNTRTAILDHVMNRMPEIYEALMAATPIDRLAEPEEIANAVVWLCSDSASYVSGHAMVVDGCYSIQ